MKTLAAFLYLAMLVSAQSAGMKFGGRLSPVPIDAAMRSTVTGSGAASAVLEGTKLSVTGSFSGMQGPATRVELRMGVAAGVRGPAIGELTISHAMEGRVSGTATLNAVQVDALRKGKLYIQIGSEKAPEGNLWGWLLAQEGR